MISQNILKMIGDAMMAHDSVRVSTLRMLSSELKNEKINLQHDLTEEEELKVIRKEAKKRKEAIEMYTKASAVEQAESEKAELAILSEFLPPEISEEELERLVNESISELLKADPSATLRTSMGKVIADVKSKNSGVDGSAVAAIVRSKLSN